MLTGGGILALGVLLLLLKLLVLVAWYGAGIIALAGGIMLIVGVVMGRP